MSDRSFRHCPIFREQLTKDSSRITGKPVVTLVSPPLQSLDCQEYGAFLLQRH